MPKSAKPKRRQLNIGVTPEQYEMIQAAALAEEVTVTEFCRDAIMSRAEPEPEPVGVSAVPAWLVHLLLFFSRGRARSA